MSDILNSTPSTYSTYASVMTMNPALVRKSTTAAGFEDRSYEYPDYTSFQPMPLQYPTVPTHYGYYTEQRVKKQPDSSDSSSPPTPPSQSATFTQPNTTSERVKETIARAHSVPMEFYHTEFLEYSKETYERKMNAKRHKRKRLSPYSRKPTSEEDEDDEDEDEDEDEEEPSSTELRRQIHIQSEQKRRAQIKDGFEELKNHLPGCTSKKMSKAALLTRTVQQINHLKKVQNDLLSEVEKLAQENEALKKFQQNVLQRQAMENYTFQV
ncbi:hypothetical protein BDF14DRAFT_1800650 [Spinellus fusiger]|nr:hypothetical protein BDF14DRAFT_1800650 [Spinellus fusiger]